jgi:tetratricopeptide (TPR) repeat protein
MRRASPVSFAFLVLCLAAPALRAAEARPAVALRSDLAVYSRPVSTASPEAQRYFDQGLVLYYGFNHQAAIASFAKAAEIDTTCAMAWWGQAISHGPHINNPTMDEAAARAAFDASRRALALSPKASAAERSLIEAVAARYAWPSPEDRRALDVAYSDAMRKVWAAYPDDADVGALFADAAMNLRPWDLWSPSGDPRPETPEIKATLERVLTMAPDHPMACHLYIHAMEASPTPEKALAAADRLRTRVPGSAHLVHMPAHIDVRLGRYPDAIAANQKAIEVDRTWAGLGGFYALYRAHNFHFLAYAAMFDGQKEMALKAARAMVTQIPLEQVRAMPDFLDGFMAVPTHVMVRFGMWDELIAAPRPPDDLVVTVAFWHYGRTVALAALGRVEEAGAELAALRKAFEAVPESRTIGNNTARTVLEVGLPMAEGELEYRLGRHDRAFELLRQAVGRDVSLHYDEPWGWMMPVRHSLGALLLQQERVQEAEAVYRSDLALHPENGWALHGLSECLALRGDEQGSAAADARFREAWKRADVTIQGSCYCRKAP